MSVWHGVRQRRSGACSRGVHRSRNPGNGVPGRVSSGGIMEDVWEVLSGCRGDPQAESQAGREKLGQKVFNGGVTLPTKE